MTKIKLIKVPADRYNSAVGEPLYYYVNEEGDGGFVRGLSRAKAKSEVLKNLERPASEVAFHR